MNQLPAIAGFFLRVLYKIDMTSSIPDGISFGDLEAMQKDAARRDAEREVQESIERAKAAAEEKPDAHYDGKTRDEVIDIAASLVENALQQCNDPMVHKLMMMMIIDNFLEWHTKAGINQMEDGDTRSSVCWLRDAGKFQAIHNILDTITTGPKDWTVGE